MDDSIVLFLMGILLGLVLGYVYGIYRASKVLFDVISKRK